MWKRLFSKPLSLSLVPPIPSAQELLSIALEKNDIPLMIQALSENLSLLTAPDGQYEGNDIVHMVMLRGTSREFILKSLEMLKNHFDYNPQKNINRRKYTPLMTLMVNNPCFYEKFLGDVLLDLVPNFFPTTDLPEDFQDSPPFLWLLESLIPKERILSLGLQNPVPFYNTLFLPQQLSKANYPPIGIFKKFQEEIQSSSFELFSEKIIGPKQNKPLRKLIFNEIITVPHRGFERIAPFSFLSCLIEDPHKLTQALTYLVTGERLDYFQKCFNLEIINYRTTKSSTSHSRLKNQWRMATDYSLSEQIIPKGNNLLSLSQEFINNEGVDRFIKFFIERNGRMEEADTLLMYKTYTKEIGDLDLNRFYNLNELHDYLAREITRILNKPFPLHQDNIKSLDGVELDETTSIFVPQENIDVAQAGLSLNICIGSGRYSQGVVTRQWNIIFLKQNNQFYAAIQFDAEGIIEAKTKNNRTLPSLYVTEIRKLIKDLRLYNRTSEILPF